MSLSIKKLYLKLIQGIKVSNVSQDVLKSITGSSFTPHELAYRPKYEYLPVEAHDVFTPSVTFLSQTDPASSGDRVSHN